jgi:hypothetical protein
VVIGYSCKLIISRSETNGSICDFNRRDCRITGAIGLCCAATFPRERATAGPDSCHHRARTIGGSHAGPASSRTSSAGAGAGARISADTNATDAGACSEQNVARRDFRPPGFETRQHRRHGGAQAKR